MRSRGLLGTFPRCPLWSDFADAGADARGPSKDSTSTGIIPKEMHAYTALPFLKAPQDILNTSQNAINTALARGRSRSSLPVAPAAGLAMPRSRRMRPGGDMSTTLQFAQGAKSQNGRYGSITGGFA